MDWNKLFNMKVILKEFSRKPERMLSYINIVTLHEVCEKLQTVGAERFCAKPRCNRVQTEM